MSAQGTTVVLMANGEPPARQTALDALRTADWLVCCDGAVQTARACGREPDFAVGDGDSLPADERRRLGARYVAIREQETNDLDKAFRFAMGREGEVPFPRPDEILILGATGLREDHTLGNIFRLPDFVRRAGAATRIRMVTDSGIFEVVTRTATFACAPGDAVSVFATDPETHMTSTGLVWPLDGVTFANLWCATLNRTSAATFTVTTDRPVILYREGAEA